MKHSNINLRFPYRGAVERRKWLGALALWMYTTRKKATVLHMSEHKQLDLERLSRIHHYFWKLCSSGSRFQHTTAIRSKLADNMQCWIEKSQSNLLSRESLRVAEQALRGRRRKRFSSASCAPWSTKSVVGAFSTPHQVAQGLLS